MLSFRYPWKATCSFLALCPISCLIPMLAKGSVYKSQRVLLQLSTINMPTLKIVFLGSLGFHIETLGWQQWWWRRGGCWEWGWVAGRGWMWTGGCRTSCPTLQRAALLLICFLFWIVYLIIYYKDWPAQMPKTQVRSTNKRIGLGEAWDRPEAPCFYSVPAHCCHPGMQTQGCQVWLCLALSLPLFFPNEVSNPDFYVNFLMLKCCNQFQLNTIPISTTLQGASRIHP